MNGYDLTNTVIPGGAKRRPGIHSSAVAVDSRLLGNDYGARGVAVWKVVG